MMTDNVGHSMDVEYAVEGLQSLTLKSVVEGCNSPSKPHEDEDAANLCAICLDCPDPADSATIPTCSHHYCVTCILRWASGKDVYTCPQCKLPFDELMTHRRPSGTLSDYVLRVRTAELLDSCWFAYFKRIEKGKETVQHVPEDYEDDPHLYDYYDEDQEVEDYYFSAAAGSARIVLGNRRFGDGGFVSSGRRNARPVQQKATKAKGKTTPTPGGAVHLAAHKRVQTGENLSPSPSGASSSGGRRARRNARRQASDLVLD